MLSFNHHAFGAVGAWLYRTVAGIQPHSDGIAWRRFRVCPRPGGSLTHAQARVRVPYGPIESAWRIKGDRLAITVEVPPNTAADVLLP